jgi:hypothetical protein
MSSPKDPKERRVRVAPRHESNISTGGKWAIGLSIAGVAGLLVLVGFMASGSHRRAAAPLEVKEAPEPEAPKARPAPAKAAVSEADVEEFLKQHEAERERARSEQTPSTGGLRQRINDEYLAAKRRATLYAGQNRWKDALGAYDRLLDRYDDQELMLRCDVDQRELRDKAKIAFKAKMAEADKLAADGKFADARKVLSGIVEAFGRDEYVEPAQARIKELFAREDADAAARFIRLMTPIEQMLPEWRFDEALAEIQKLQFDRPQYKEQHARRLERIRFLAAIKKKIIAAIENARPRLNKRTYYVPGMPGEVTGADAQLIYSTTARGDEKVAWPALGVECMARLAHMVGDSDDPAHRIAVARLLMEVGQFDRARRELAKAKELKGKTAADEAELAEREKQPPPEKPSAPEKQAPPETPAPPAK